LPQTPILKTPLKTYPIFMMLICSFICIIGYPQEIIPPVPTGFGPQSVQSIQPIEGESLVTSVSYTQDDCDGVANNAWGGADCFLSLYCCQNFFQNNGQPTYKKACKEIDDRGGGACPSFPFSLEFHVLMFFTLIVLFLQFYYEIFPFKKLKLFKKYY